VRVSFGGRRDCANRAVDAHPNGVRFRRCEAVWRKVLWCLREVVVKLLFMPKAVTRRRLGRAREWRGVNMAEGLVRSVRATLRVRIGVMVGLQLRW